MNSDKRKHARVPTNLSARWHGVSGSHEGRVEDLSVGGCFINTKGAADPGEIVNLLIQLPRGGWFPLQGKVAFYQQLIGFSVSFLIDSDKDREVLKNLVMSQLPK